MFMAILTIHLWHIWSEDDQVERKAGVKERNSDRSPKTVFLTLKTFRGSGVQLIARFSKIGIFFSISLSNAEAHGSPLSTNLAPKKKSLHKTLPLIDLIHFPILPWEPNVFLLQSTNFPVSSLTCVIWLQVRAGCHSSRVSSQELSFSQNSPALPSYKIIPNNVLLTSKDVLSFPVRFKFTEDGFNNPFGLLHWKKETIRGEMALSFYNQLSAYDLNAFLSFKGPRDLEPLMKWQTWNPLANLTQHKVLIIFFYQSELKNLFFIVKITDWGCGFPPRPWSC